MRIRTTLIAGGLALSLLGGACNDDTDLDAGDEPAGDGSGSDVAPDGSAATVPTTPPDLTGTITSVSPFEPVTEDCTPPEDLDPDGAVSSDDPPVCTPEDNDVVGTILVEETPNDASAGRKISFTVTSDSAITGETADGTKVGVFGDLAEGQTVETWVAGDVCAESFPEQCGLEAVKVTG